MECGACTSCCTLLKVDELNKAAGEECKHCTFKCEIYSTRPQSCRDLSCAYHQMQNVSIRLRPDYCGVVFEKLADDLMFGSVDPNHKDLSVIHGQINYFLNEGINTVLVRNGCSTVYHLDAVEPGLLLQRVHKMAQV